MSPLAALIAERIVAEGPISIADYMAMALYHPRYGYYRRRHPIGADGDFVTAPEISQMFGELVGVWCSEVWRSLGCPDPFALVEVGPGRGTLMADALRAIAAVRPACAAALRVHLVEISVPLRRQQRRTLRAGRSERPVRWHADLASVPDGPAVIVANEVFDALPVRQYVRRSGAWLERRVGLDPETARFDVVEKPPAPDDDPPPDLADVADGAIVEVAPAARAMMAAIARRVIAAGGAALVVDFGHEGGIGDTVQAVRRHAFHDVLAAPGEVDLSAHVDFAALAAVATAAGARAYGPLPQGEFLVRLGIGVRAERLAATGTAAGQRALALALRRLVSPFEMGTLFKVLAVTAPMLAPPPGFSGTEPAAAGGT